MAGSEKRSEWESERTNFFFPFSISAWPGRSPPGAKAAEKKLAAGLGSRLAIWLRPRQLSRNKKSRQCQARQEKTFSNPALSPEMKRKEEEEG